MTPQEVIAAHSQRYDEDRTDWICCTCGEWRVDSEQIDFSGNPDEQADVQFAAHLLDALHATGHVVVQLPEWPEGADMGVIAIDMEPDEDDKYAGGPFLVVRFGGIDKPGRLFDRRPLAAALLAAANHAEEQTA